MTTSTGRHRSAAHVARHVVRESPLWGVVMSTAPHCAHWIARKQRFCSSTVTQTGEVYCSQHTPEALSEARARVEKILQNTRPPTYEMRNRVSPMDENLSRDGGHEHERPCERRRIRVRNRLQLLAALDDGAALRCR